MLAWGLDIAALRSVSSSWVSSPNAAFGISLCGLALALLAGKKSSKPLRLIPTLLAMMALCLGGLTLAEYFFGWEFGLDQGLVHDAAATWETSHSRRMQPTTAFCFVLVGCALLTAAQRAALRLRRPVVEALAVAVVIIGSLALIGFVTQAGPGYRGWNYTRMAVYSAGGFVLLGAGLLALARSEGGLRWTLDTLTTTGFVTGIALLLAAEGISHHYTDRLEKDGAWVSSAQQKLKKIEEIETDMITIESAQRGYVITGDEQMLATRDQAKRQVVQDVADLRKLTADNPDQHRRILKIEPLLDHGADFGDRMIEARRQQGFPAAAQLAAADEGGIVSDKVRRAMEGMETEQYALLEQRESEARATSTKIFLLLPLGTLLSLAMLSTGLLFLNKDVGERREAQAAAAQLAAIVKSSGDAIVGEDLRGIVTSWNAGAERLFGFPASEMKGQPITRLLPTTRQSEEDEILCRIQRGENIPPFDTVRMRKDGSVIPVSISVSAIKDAAGQVIGASKVARDITKRKAAEEQVREQAALLDRARDAILVQDLSGCLRYWNKSAERVFGWTAEEAIGRNVQSFLYGKPALYHTALEDVLSKGDWMGELSNCTKAGGEVLIESHWTLLRDEIGEPKSILAINTDISEKRALEEQFFRSQRMESIGALAGGIAHDLNNVLGPIIMGIDLLKRRMAGSESSGVLEMMETSGRRGADMVKQVLLFARGIEGHRAPISPARLITDLQRIVRDTFPKSISVDADVPAETWDISGDHTQLHQVLLNLCVNARDAMGDGGPLRISARNHQIDEQAATMMRPVVPAGPYVVLEVADTGEGMPPEVVKRIFEPFFTTKEPGKGTGLGLSTTHAIVKSHRGFITVKSELRRGTTFQVSLPAEIKSPNTERETMAEEIPRGNGELILIIDDEAAARSITGQTLETFGYRVLRAGDGIEGIVAYAKQPDEIAAVITDMEMPVMDGAATIRVLLRMNPKVKIIAASGSTTRAMEAEAAREGVTHFMAKPYTAETMLRTLSDLLHPAV